MDLFAWRKRFTIGASCSIAQDSSAGIFAMVVACGGHRLSVQPRRRGQIDPCAKARNL